MTATKHTGGSKTGCPICKTPPKKAKIFSKDGLCFVTTCGRCKVPMLVVYGHRKEEDFTEAQLQLMNARCTYVAGVAFPGRYLIMDRKTQHWPDHMHWHLRPGPKFDDDIKETE